MINMDKALASAVKTGKVSFGSNVALQNAKTGKAKMIVLASNCPKDIKEQIEYYGEISKCPCGNLQRWLNGFSGSLQETFHHFSPQH
jgi:ribosomal protein L30E